MITAILTLYALASIGTLVFLVLMLIRVPPDELSASDVVMLGGLFLVTAVVWPWFWIWLYLDLRRED